MERKGTAKRTVHLPQIQANVNLRTFTVTFDEKKEKGRKKKVFKLVASKSDQKVRGSNCLKCEGGEFGFSQAYSNLKNFGKMWSKKFFGNDNYIPSMH